MTNDKDELFVGRDDLLRTLAEQLRAGTSVLLTGGAGSGKTALIRHLDLGGTGWQLLQTDTHGWDNESLGTAFGALRSVLEGLNSGSYPDATRDDIHHAAALVAPFTLVIDGADRLLRHGWCGDFFSELRYWDETLLRSRVSFLLTGGPVLAEYQDRDNGNSPPLGTAVTTPMPPLAAGAVQQLIDALPTDRQPALTEVMQRTGGNAWLTTEFLRELSQGQTLAAATNTVYTASIRRFAYWEQQLTEDARHELAQIPRSGRLSAATRNGDRALHQHLLEMKALTVGVLYPDAPGHVRVPQLFRDWFNEHEHTSRVWQVAISYAPVDEAEARRLADELDQFYEVFFAPSQNIQLLQSDPMDNPPGLYRSRARCELILFTATYRQRYWKDTWAQRDGLLRFAPAGAIGDDSEALSRDKDGGLRALRHAIDRILPKEP